MPSQGILLVNLGSPDSPSVPDVRRYLREFLMDGRVIDIPYPARFALVNGVIAPFRAKQSAEAYNKIWTAEGSPLVAVTVRLAAKLRHELGVPVEAAMRYQNPSIPLGLLRLMRAGVRRVLLIPLFPHYAMSSYESAVVEVERVANRIAPEARIETMPPYFGDSGYIDALVAASDVHAGPFDHLLFSFHGVPERHIQKTDPTGCHCLKSAGCCEAPDGPEKTCYRRQCLATVRRFAERAGLPESRYSYAFQSRLGRDKWLAPATQDQLIHLTRSGVKRLAVICPAFTVDCLETLEEIGMRGRESFLAEGGEEFRLIPCLNDHPVWVRALAGMARRHGIASVAPEVAAQSVVR